MTPLRVHLSDRDPLDAKPAAKAAPDEPPTKTRPERPKAAVAPAVYLAEDIQVLIGVSPVTLDRMIAAGAFPAPFTPRRKKRRWLRRSVDQWLDAEAERSPRGRRR